MYVLIFYVGWFFLDSCYGVWEILFVFENYFCVDLCWILMLLFFCCDMVMGRMFGSRLSSWLVLCVVKMLVSWREVRLGLFRRMGVL